MRQRVSGGGTGVVREGWAHAHHHVEVPGARRTGLASGLDQGLGTGRPAGEMVQRSGEELCARSVHHLDPRMVDEVPSDPGDVLSDVDREARRGRPRARCRFEAGSQEIRRRLPPERRDRRRSRAPRHRNGRSCSDSPFALEAQPVDQRVGHDREVRPLPRRIEIGERSVPTNVADRVDHDRRGTFEGSGIVEVLEQGKADLRSRVESGAHEWLEVVHSRGTNAKHLLAETSVGFERGIGPSRVPRRSPLVEVRR